MWDSFFVWSLPHFRCCLRREGLTQFVFWHNLSLLWVPPVHGVHFPQFVHPVKQNKQIKSLPLNKKYTLWLIQMHDFWHQIRLTPKVLPWARRGFRKLPFHGAVVVEEPKSAHTRISSIFWKSLTINLPRALGHVASPLNAVFVTNPPGYHKKIFYDVKKSPFCYIQHWILPQLLAAGFDGVQPPTFSARITILWISFTVLPT